MEIKFSNHSKLQMTARGANENEVIQAIEEGNGKELMKINSNAVKNFYIRIFLLLINNIINLKP